MHLPLRALATALVATFPSLLTAQALDSVIGVGLATVPHSSALVPTNLTVEAWIQLSSNATDTYGTIVRKNVSTTEAYVLRLSRFQTSAWYVEFNLTTTSGTHIVQAFGATIQPDTPTHLAATYDGNRVRIYVNGSQVREAFVTGAIQDTGNELWIGEGDFGNPIGESFHGLIDAVRIWNTARTAAEIDETIDVELTSAPGLVAAWNFDYDTADSTGNGHDADGYAGGPPDYADEFAAFAGAVDLDTAGDHLTVPHHAALAPNEFLVEAWCMVQSLTPDSPVLLGKNVSGPETYALTLFRAPGFNAYHPEFRFRTTTGFHSVIGWNTLIAPGRRVHIAGAYDGTSGRLYVNSNLAGEAAASEALVDTGGDLSIGRGNASSAFSNQFLGKLDAVRIWNRVPSSCAIVGGMDRELDAGNGLVAAWNFDGGLGDDTGNGHDAVGTGHDYAPEFTSYAHALKLPTRDRVRSWVEVAHSPALVPKQFTIEGIYQLDPEYTHDYATIASKSFENFGAYVLRVGPWSRSSSTIQVEMIVSITGGGIALVATVAGDPFAPHHLAGTFDGYDARLFLDGVEIRSRSTNGRQLIDHGGVLRIGQGDPNYIWGEQMEGRIDSVRLWNHARTAADIASTMHREIDSMPGLIAAWNFNGNLTDSTGHGFNGTAVGSIDLVDEFANLVGSDCSPIAYGNPSSDCAVKPRVFASNLCEEDGITSFGCLDAPANGIGLFLFTSATRQTPSFVDGLDVWVDTASLISFGVGAAADAYGRSRVSFPVSNGYSAVLPAAVQYFWFDTSCGRTALNLTTSDALQIGPF